MFSTIDKTRFTGRVSSWTGGMALLAGVIHHLAFQHPKQKPLFETVIGFAAMETAGAAALFAINTLSLITLLNFTWCYVLLAPI